MKRVLILGAKGMAGQTITKYLVSQKKYEVFSTFRKKNNEKLKENEFELDAFNTQMLENILQKIRPNFVINCIGILNQVAENNPDIAVYINGYFPHLLNKLTQKYGGKLIHITTDCVFSGKKGSYVECDFRDAESFYGRTKAIGEVNDNSSLTFRTSIIGPDENKNGIGLFKWFLEQEGEINGYSNVMWAGVTTLELAKAIESSFEQNLTGIYNLTNNEKISKYDLLKLFEKYTKKEIIINKFENYHSDKSILDTRKEIKYKVQSYEKMIKEMCERIESENNRY